MVKVSTSNETSENYLAKIAIVVYRLLSAIQSCELSSEQLWYRSRLLHYFLLEAGKSSAGRKSMGYLKSICGILILSLITPLRMCEATFLELLMGVKLAKSDRFD